MKYLTLTTIFIFLISPVWTQITSDCTVPPELAEAYDKDVKGLVIKRMQALNSPDQTLIEIPQIWQDSIMEGMAAIFNAPDLPERDSVFDLYCVHDRFSSPALLGFIIGVDTNTPMADAWSTGELLTGNAILDTLLVKYNFELTNYFSFGAGVFYTDQYLNLFALADSIVSSVPGVSYGEPDYLIGGAGQIVYATDELGNRYYDFRYEWNDCFDGCDNFYTWKFLVSPQCEVEFLGTDEGGFFGLEDLPEPTNCMLTDVEQEFENTIQIEIFPNPVSEELFVYGPEVLTQWRIFDNLGRLVKQGKIERSNISVESLVPGIYWFYAVSAEGKSYPAQAFVKQ
jgi:hypothetical protein